MRERKVKIMFSGTRMQTVEFAVGSKTCQGSVCLQEYTYLLYDPGPSVGRFRAVWRVFRQGAVCGGQRPWSFAFAAYLGARFRLTVKLMLNK